MSNSSQYLLTVAERIMEKQVDKDLLHKYYRIKDQALKRPNKKASRRDSLKLNKKNSRLSLKSMHRPSSALSKSHPVKNQTIKRLANTNSTQQKQNRMVNAFKSTSSKYQTIPDKSDGQTIILSHISEVLKTASRCPQILNNIKLIDCIENKIDKKDRQHLKEISCSLSGIYEKLTKIDLQNTISKDKIRVSFPNRQSHSHLNKKDQVPNVQLSKDNKWLIDKLELILKQNLILRRMIGKN